MDDVANAIADPVRRRILDLLRSGDLTAGEIAARFTISRPAVSRHLRVLRESGLVRDRLAGRQRLYGVRSEGLSELGGWISRFTEPATEPASVLPRHAATAARRAGDGGPPDPTETPVAGADANRPGESA